MSTEQLGAVLTSKVKSVTWKCQVGGILWWDQEGVEWVLSDDVHTNCSVLRSTIFLVEAYLVASSCDLYCYRISIHVTILVSSFF